MKRLPLLLVLVLAISSSLVFIACGSDDSDDGGSAPTKAEFITEADAICSKGDQEIDDAGNEQFGNQAPSQEELTAFATDTVVPNIEQQASDLRELTPPEGDEDAFNAILDALDEGIATIKEDPEAALNGDKPLAEANRLAQEYGFTSCGDGDT